MKSFGIAGVAGLGNLLGGLAGMPWQALLAYTVVAVLCSTVVAVAQIVVPQDSGDKVLWWGQLLRRGRRSPRGPADGGSGPGAG
jgi:hypothetical protein